MSEREPITAELRELMGGVEPRVDEDGVVTAKYVTPEAWGDFERCCDAIDAVHAQLERENAELRQRVAVLDKRGDSMHDGGSITDELRAWWLHKFPVMDKELHKDFTAIADRIDAEHERECKEQYACGVEHGIGASIDASMIQTHGYVELPKDADGEYIHVGDRLDGYGKTIEVVEMRHGRSGWVLISRDGNGYADTFAFSHHHVPTVEDVLRKFADEMNQNLGMYTGEAIDADEWRDADNKTIAEFATKLRLAGDAS